MQFGGLSAGEQTQFIADQAEATRKPTFCVWIEGLGDVNDDILSIETFQGIEESRDREHFVVGRATVIAGNVDATFYSSESLIDTDARIKIWSGFSDNNIPMFTGIIKNVMPDGMSNTVVLSCQDNMGLMRLEKIKGDQGDTDTPKKLIENFCDRVGVTYDIPSTSENNAQYSSPQFYEQTLFNAMKLIGDSIFSVAWFDEDGELQFKEREWSNPVDFTIDDDNHLEVIRMADTYVINDLEIEYRPDFYARKEDAASIEEHRKRSRRYTMDILDSVLVSSHTAGATDEEISNVEGFKFTTSSDAVVIDCIQVMVAQDDAHGDIVLGIYADEAGEPGALIQECVTRQANELMPYPFFTWAIFQLEESLLVDRSAAYWCALDVSDLSEGTVYFQISKASRTGEYAYKTGAAWTKENSKLVLHQIRGSRQARRVVEDMLEFYKDPHERIRVVAPAIPQLQLMDEVLVDVTVPDTFLGAYVIESREHIFTQEYYITVDTMRRKG